ncbi:MAG: hypothetical protein ACE3JK_01595 [Sporolactobacillus sp.]
MKTRKIVMVLTLIFALIVGIGVPTANAASLHTSYYAHTVKHAAYHYKRSGKSKVHGHIKTHKNLRVNNYYKGWYKVIWGKRYVWVYKKYVRKGKYIAASSASSQASSSSVASTNSTQSVQSQSAASSESYPKTITLPDGGKIIENADGSHYNPDPSQGGSTEPIALQVAQAEVIDLGGGAITANSDGSYTVIVPKEIIAAEAKKAGASIKDYPDGSYSVYYSHKTNSFDDPTYEVDVRDDGSYTNIGITVEMPNK